MTRHTVLFEPVQEGGYDVIVPALPEICTVATPWKKPQHCS
jgi:predicted RNase H-like HicB family nuclease